MHVKAISQNSRKMQRVQQAETDRAVSPKNTKSTTNVRHVSLFSTSLTDNQTIVNKPISPTNMCLYREIFV